MFTLWGPRAPRTALSRRQPARAGEPPCLGAGERSSPRAPLVGSPVRPVPAKPDGDLEELLRDSVRLRLRADVPVGALYLSGGLDSSLITALAAQETDHQLRTFSVAFRDPGLRREPPPARGRPRRSAPSTTCSRLERRRSRVAFPDVVEHAEVAADPHGAGAAVPARPRRAGQRDHRCCHGRGRRRALLGL